MSALVMRTATRDDLPAIVAMLFDDDLGRTREIVSDPVDPAYVAGFEAITADPNQHLVVAELDDKIVGTMQLSYLPGIQFRGGWRQQVEAVRVDSRIRGQGLGRRMMDWAIDQARQRGCMIVQLSSQNDRKDAHRFYERLGFDRDHVQMKYYVKD
ncbi:MAG: GNAT family N-acetyltransferase [Sphingopyxis sp.]|uniref:GNAT family N-acetyltransferase n=1 Tax=Sphingopyxis sp. TaxID=1908224 RepID=UPI001A4AD661|nr:GNAT family N-acetyltransferase [Sphingopyxis sp.]MBL9065414.1 GNAT family N-acetyltransferase [Sphingopyxis sp.]